jgi:hypothetical protein
VNGKLGELGELPQAVTARISGLESRLGRMAKSSEMWLNELTKLTADLSDRINRRQNPASPPVVANDPDAEARR